MAKKTRSKIETVAAATLAMTATVDTSASSATPEDAALADLLKIIDGDFQAAADQPADVVVETNPASEPPAIAAPVLTDSDLAKAVSAAEAVEAMIAGATADAHDAGVEDETTIVPPATEATSGEAAPAKVRTPRKHYTNKAERIADRLGDSLGEYTVLTLDDAAKALDEDALKATSDATMALIAGMSKKKQNRAGFLLEFVSGKKATLNNVMAIALRTLHENGAITTGKEGNFLTALLAVPYSPAAARAMGGNTVAVLEDLKLISPDGKGKYVANSDSLLLAAVNAKLGLGAPAAGEPAAASTETVEPSSEAVTA